MALTCNILKYLIFSMIVGLIALHPAPGPGQEWGKITTTTEKTAIRAARSFNANITAQFDAGDPARVDFLKDSRYPVVAQIVKTDQKAGNVSEETRTAATSRKEPPLLVRNIYVKFEPAGHEKVFIDFNRDVTPEISSIGGKDPRIVIDIKNVLSIRQGIKRIEVQGKLIRQVRSNLDHASRRLRIVVDLAPSRNYDVDPVFYKAEKIYMLDISEAPVDQKK